MPEPHGTEPSPWQSWRTTIVVALLGIYGRILWRAAEGLDGRDPFGHPLRDLVLVPLVALLVAVPLTKVMLWLIEGFWRRVLNLRPGKGR